MPTTGAQIVQMKSLMQRQFPKLFNRIACSKLVRCNLQQPMKLMKSLMMAARNSLNRLNQTVVWEGDKNNSLNTSSHTHVLFTCTHNIFSIFEGKNGEKLLKDGKVVSVSDRGWIVNGRNIIAANEGGRLSFIRIQPLDTRTGGGWWWVDHWVTFLRLLHHRNKWKRNWQKTAAASRGGGSILISHHLLGTWLVSLWYELKGTSTKCSGCGRHRSVIKLISRDYTQFGWVGAHKKYPANVSLQEEDLEIETEAEAKAGECNQVSFVYPSLLYTL